MPARSGTVERGEILYRAGDEDPDFFAILDGDVEILLGDAVVTARERRRLPGRAQHGHGTAPVPHRARHRPGRVVVVPSARFRELMSTKPELSDTIFRSFVARRELLRAGDGAGAIQIVGVAVLRRRRWRCGPSRIVPGSRTRGSTSRTSTTCPGSSPAWVRGCRTCRWSSPRPPASATPRPASSREHLGLTFHADAGPARRPGRGRYRPGGLAASVYGASEGLTTISVDAVGPGGQAGASSRIENYVGFPNGVSGDDLVARASIQAMRLGARLNAPCEVGRLRSEHEFHVVALGRRQRDLHPCGHDRDRRPLPAPRRPRPRALRGRRRLLRGHRPRGTRVRRRAGRRGRRWQLGRAGGDLPRPAGQPRHARHPPTRAHRHDVPLPRGADRGRPPDRAARADRGARRWPAPRTSRRRRSSTPRRGTRTAVDCRGVFCFIGAVPATGWLDGALALDRSGFVLTDRSLPEAVGGVDVRRTRSAPVRDVAARRVRGR